MKRTTGKELGAWVGPRIIKDIQTSLDIWVSSAFLIFLDFGCPEISPCRRKKLMDFWIFVARSGQGTGKAYKLLATIKDVTIPCGTTINGLSKKCRVTLPNIFQTNVLEFGRLKNGMEDDWLKQICSADQNDSALKRMVSQQRCSFMFPPSCFGKTNHMWGNVSRRLGAPMTPM